MLHNIAANALPQILLNTSKKQEISEVVDIDLSRDEDSVTSLAFAQSTEQWATAFAGINSSEAEQKAGQNQHLRSFLLEYPPRRKVNTEETDPAQEKFSVYKGKTEALGRVSYFTPSSAPKPGTYQRTLRLSKKRRDNGPRLGAVATGLAPQGEIVVFAADTNRPSKIDIRGRLKLGKNEEAADMDVMGLQGDETNFRIVYCTDYNIFLTRCNHGYNRSEDLEPQSVHSKPFPDVFAMGPRPKFRSLRFLTPTLLVILENLPNGKGVQLVFMDTAGQILLTKKLQKKIKSGIGLSVASLPFTSQNGGKRIQSAIAVAGADTSITILIAEHGSETEYRDLEVRSHLFLPSVHPTSITSLTFSTYDPPSSPQTSPQPQILKLASTSIANTVVVHTFPLQPYSLKKKSTEPVPSFVLSKPGSNKTLNENVVSIIVGLLAISMGMFFLQVFAELKSAAPGPLGARNWLSESWQNRISGLTMSEFARSTVEYVSSKVEHKADPPIHKAEEKAEDAYDKVMKTNTDTEEPNPLPIEKAEQGGEDAIEKNTNTNTNTEDPDSTASFESSTPRTRLRDLLRQHASSNPGSSSPNDPDSKPPFTDAHAILISHTPSGSEIQDRNEEARPLSAELHHPDTIAEKLGGKAKKWEDLLEHERLAWKLRLMEAGEWAVEEGESVLKGVFFSGLAQGVAGVVGGG